MTDLRIVREVSTVTRGTGDDQWTALRGTRDGAPFMATWVQGLCMEGRVFCANVATVTSPSTLGAGGIDTTEPDLIMIVPTSTTVIPLEIRVYVEAWGADGVGEGTAAVGTGLVAGTDTDLVVGATICNLRTDAPFTSNCYIAGASNADATYFTANSSEFWRFGETKAVTITTADDDCHRLAMGSTFIWRYTGGFFPVLRGGSGAGMVVFGGTGATHTGFITLVYAEVPSSSII